MKKICVVGLGYIGLPTASILATHGYSVCGVDISPKIVEIINKGNIHIEEPGLKTLVQAAVKSGNLQAYLTPQKADIYIIAVPTPVEEDTKKADLSCIESAANSIVDKLKAGDLVILESTSPPGTTEDFLISILEKSGLKIGEELFVAYCPERVLPGKIIKELIQNTRVIGGVNKASAQKARKIYASFVEGEIYLTDTTTAEMVKIMENTFRDVNIALSNELAKISHQIGINAWEVIKLANLHPRVNLHKPGPGVGGHCISVDPWFIVEKVPDLAKLISQSRNINDSMPEFTYNLLLKHIKNITNPKITVLGVSYKADVDDTRESPASKIVDMITSNPNLNLAVYDPHVKYFDCELTGFEEAFTDSDCILLLVDHSEFKYIDPGQIAKIVKNKLIIDTRNILDRQRWEKNGFKYVLLGQGEKESISVKSKEKVLISV